MQIWQQIRHGKHVGFEEGMSVPTSSLVCSACHCAVRRVCCVGRRVAHEQFGRLSSASSTLGHRDRSHVPCSFRMRARQNSSGRQPCYRHCNAALCPQLRHLSDGRPAVILALAQSVLCVHPCAVPACASVGFVVLLLVYISLRCE